MKGYEDFMNNSSNVFRITISDFATIQDYFATDADTLETIRPSDRLIIEVHRDSRYAAYMIVPEGENPGNCVPSDDDFRGVLEFLARNSYAAPWMIDWLESN